jgi:flagellar assembly protein FliH
MSESVFTSWRPTEISIESPGYQPSPAELREKAAQEGYAQGYSEGLLAGKAEAKSHTDALVSHLSHVIEQLETPFGKMEQEVSGYLLSLVGAICKTVLKRELAHDEDQIAEILRCSLQSLAGERGNVSITLHPDDRAVVEAHWSPELGELNITADPNLIRGGCRLTRKDAVVDATKETQLRGLIMELSAASVQRASLDKSLEPLDPDSVQATMVRLSNSVDKNES